MPFEKSAAHSGADAVTEGKDALTLPEKEVVGYNAPQDKVVAGFQLKKARFLIENGLFLYVLSKLSIAQLARYLVVFNGILLCLRVLCAFSI